MTKRCFPVVLTFFLGALLFTGQGASALVQVLDEAGLPVAGAKLLLYRQAGSSSLLAALQTPLATTTSNEAGFAELPQAALENLLLLVDHERHSPLSLQLASSLPETVRLPETEAWTGSIRGEQDIEDGEICATWTQTFPAWEVEHTWKRCAVPQTAGSFTIYGAPTGQRFDIDLRVPGFLPLRQTNLTIETAPAFQLRTGIGLEGEVRARDGRVITDAQIACETSNGWSRARTDREGRFLLAVERWPVVLWVRAPGFRQEKIELKRAPRETVKVVLVHGEQLAGHLVESQGKPLEEVRLRLEQIGEHQRRTIPARLLDLTDGAFLVDLPAPGRYAGKLQVKDMRPLLIPEFTIGAGETHSLGVLTVDRGGSVRAVVRDSILGEPVMGVVAELIPQGMSALPSGGSRPRITGHDGTFEFGGLDTGRFELRLRHRAYAITVARFTAYRDQSLDLGDLYLHNGVHVQAEILGRDGLPNSGLVVRIFDPEQATLEPLLDRVTDTDGRVQNLVLAPGRYRVQVHDERLLLTQEIEVPAHRATWSPRWTVGGTLLTGRVTEGGLPVDGGFLILSSSFDPGQQRGKVVVNAPHLGPRPAIFGAAQTQMIAEVDTEGHFEIANVPPGLVQVTCFRPDGSSVRRQILVPEPDSATEVRLELRGKTLDGYVTDEQGLGVGRARVQLRDELGLVAAEVTTGLDGSFRLQDLQTGAYHLDVSADNHVSTRQENLQVSENNTPVHIQLARGANGGVDVTLERADGSPAARVMATLLDGGGQMVRAGLTDTGGRYQFDRLAAGEYFVVWNDPVAGTGASPIVQVRSGKTAVMALELQAGASSRVACHLEACASGSVQRIALYSTDGIDVAPYLTGISPALRFAEDGRLSLGRITPGNYRLEVWTGERRLRREIEISDAVEFEEPLEIAVH